MFKSMNLKNAVFIVGLVAAAAPQVGAQTSVAPKSSARVAPPSYDQLRRSFKVNPRITLALVRADVATHAGRVIELHGTISGIMTIQNVRTVLLKVDDATLAMPIPREMQSEALRSGANVRALALVGQNAAKDEALLTLVAVADQVAAMPVEVAREVKRTTPNRNSVASLPPATKGITTLKGGDVIISPETDVAVPPMTTMRQVLPSPPPAQAPAIVAAKPGLDPNEDDQWSTQKSFFTDTARRTNKKLTLAQAREIGNAIVDAGRANGIDPRFLASIIRVESDFNIYCLSHSGAMGLGQIMPFNLKEAGITNAWNPTQNIHGTARLLRGHLNDYRNRADGTLLAVAAYNAGPGAVRRAGYKVPNGAQVQRYVWKVYYQYKAFAPDMFK